MNGKSPYYNFFWRWHFYAGLIVTPIILIMAITGGIYLLQPQIEDLLYGDLIYLSKSYNGEIDNDAIINAAKDELNAKQIHSYQPPIETNQTAQIVLTNNAGNKLTAFLNPSTHQIIGTVNEEWRLTNIARNIHKSLLLGTLGRAITELAACWLIVMIITGYYLWWSRRKSLRSLLVPNIKMNGRKLWREAHGVSGAWIGLWILALLITGLPWSMVWGGLLSDISTRAGEGFPKAIFSARPISTSDDKLPELSMNQLLKIAEEQNIMHDFKIEYPWWEKGSYALMPLRHGGGTEDIAYMFFDRRTGKILDEYRFADLGKVGKLTALGVAFHEGRLFGDANQLLNLIAVIMLITICITGPIMWWKRRPKNIFTQKSLGAPRLPANFKIPKKIIILIIVTGILLPLFGLSVMFIMVGEIVANKLRKRNAA